uniref:Uncharacterized protein n=1 Tax=Heterorhabditis bacteriophora TaxID=37862 RepID=A0A1I7X3U2_HETBA
MDALSLYLLVGHQAGNIWLNVMEVGFNLESTSYARRNGPLPLIIRSLQTGSNEYT